MTQETKPVRPLDGYDVLNAKMQAKTLAHYLFWRFVTYTLIVIYSVGIGGVFVFADILVVDFSGRQLRATVAEYPSVGIFLGWSKIIIAVAGIMASTYLGLRSIWDRVQADKTDLP